MADDLPVQPVSGITGPEPVRAPEPVRPATAPGAVPGVPGVPGAGGPVDESELDTATQRAQLLAGAATEAADLEAAAAVHDAAAHGNAIARAIEDATDALRDDIPDPDSRAQMLGGAAASAAAGQGVPMARSGLVDEDDDRVRKSDPLEPVRGLREQDEDEAQERRGRWMRKSLEENDDR